jgi:hypothetical protein
MMVIFEQNRNKQFSILRLEIQATGIQPPPPQPLRGADSMAGSREREGTAFNGWPSEKHSGSELSPKTELKVRSIALG